MWLNCRTSSLFALRYCVQRRRWTQYRDADNNDVPLIFDTWVVGEQTTIDRATCDTCGDDTFDEIIVEEMG